MISFFSLYDKNEVFMSFNISSIINSNPENYNPSTTFTGAFPAERPPVEPIVIETPGETKMGTGKNGRAISFSEEIKLHIDVTTKKALAVWGCSTLSKWVGKKWTNIPKSISIRDARLINLEAKKEVVKLNTELVQNFPVDKVMRDRLDSLGTNLRAIGRNLHFGKVYFFQLGTEKCRTISKERADAINKHIQEKNIGNGLEIFDLKRIFQLAINEQLPKEKPTKKLSENIWINLEDEDREQLRILPMKIKEMSFFTVTFDTLLRHDSILIKNAILINKLSEKNIINPTKDSINKISAFLGKLDELRSSIEEAREPHKPPDRKILDIVNRRTITVTYELAETINDCFGKTIFDLESLLTQAIQEAEEEAELVVSTYRSEQAEKEAELVASIRKPKRPSSSETSATSEDRFEPNSKRRRITDEQAARAQNPTPNENMAGMIFAGFQMPADQQVEPEFSLAGQKGCNFQPNLQAPFYY